MSPPVYHPYNAPAAAERYPGVQSQRHKRANGTYRVYHYHRLTGERLQGEPGSYEFELSYALASRTACEIKTGPIRKRSHRRVRRKGERYVYFIRATTLGLIKIGSTSQPHERFIYIQSASPDNVEMLGVMLDSGGLELKLHKQFSHLRVRGEWHVEHEELMLFIKQNAQEHERKRVRHDTKKQRYVYAEQR